MEDKKNFAEVLAAVGAALVAILHWLRNTDDRGEN